MLKVIYRKSRIRIASIWFAQERDYLFEKKCDIAFYHQISNRIEGKYKNSIFYTLVTNLSYSDEEIISKFQNSTRYKIRRAEKAGVATFLYNSKDLAEDDSIIIEFSKAYNQFLKSKNLYGKCNINAIDAYAKENSFFVSCARYNDRNLVYHAYVGDGNVARMIHSTSLFRQSDDNAEKILIGEANRMLHRDDILSFKKMGYSVYDWGGAAINEDVKGIANFKLSFGGDLLETYNCLIPCSILGSLVLTIRNGLEHLKTVVIHKGAGNEKT